jgi:hypothetical protein
VAPTAPMPPGSLKSGSAVQDVSLWASNPLVIKMLRRVRRLLKKGTVSEQELEEGLLAYLKVWP